MAFLQHQDRAPKKQIQFKWVHFFPIKVFRLHTSNKTISNSLLGNTVCQMQVFNIHFCTSEPIRFASYSSFFFTSMINTVIFVASFLVLFVSCIVGLILTEITLGVSDKAMEKTEKAKHDIR